ncbi:glycosyltransferase family A protein [Epilithonimonas ginsengisoli]|uniref:Glycosyltransferase family A protein n=1 Tax=Epilithonimonas ginsengisoli TaxID=1245592 RepID=A0ABU4JJE1_9FLAO|nr:MULTISPECIES: glycosyltransferase family A protein [Chryseobacterium group]MBV6880924.1 glycosyltransferase family 2 protein [Epilithonimonas sp. FP105]MDW8549814.1 glycosyltransferase family A protein [Epilithonimonas ginsengisoli]
MSNSAFITIFTPTYNRFTLLQRLYDSILQIEYEDFEWLVVDDGSSDDTEFFFKAISENAHFPIRYIKQKNGGKHTAINKGLEEANGELFFIVDSDDILPPNSLKNINFQFSKVKDNPKIGGIVGRKKNIAENISIYDFHEKEFISSAFDFRYKFLYQGDMAEVVKTDVLRQYPFPVFEKEKFVTESLVWFRIAKTFDFLYFDEIIYLCEYQEDGLTDNYWKLIKSNPRGSILYYKEFLENNISEAQRASTLKTIKTIALANGYSFFDLFRMLNIDQFVSLSKMTLGNYLSPFKSKEDIK